MASERSVATFGMLRSGPTKFRILPIGPEAKHRPRLAIGPGRYQLGSNERLVIVIVGHVMDAKLEFSSKDDPIASYQIKLPNQRGA